MDKEINVVCVNVVHNRVPSLPWAKLRMGLVLVAFQIFIVSLVDVSLNIYPIPTDIPVSITVLILT